MSVLNKKAFKEKVAKEMMTIARERRLHHKEAIEELKLQNQHVQKKILKRVRESGNEISGAKEDGDATRKTQNETKLDNKTDKQESQGLKLRMTPKKHKNKDNQFLSESSSSEGKHENSIDLSALKQQVSQEQLADDEKDEQNLKKESTLRLSETQKLDRMLFGSTYDNNIPKRKKRESKSSKTSLLNPSERNSGNLLNSIISEASSTQRSEKEDHLQIIE